MPNKKNTENKKGKFNYRILKTIKKWNAQISKKLNQKKAAKRPSPQSLTKKAIKHLWAIILILCNFFMSVLSSAIVFVSKALRAMGSWQKSLKHFSTRFFASLKCRLLGAQRSSAKALSSYREKGPKEIDQDKILQTCKNHALLIGGVICCGIASAIALSLQNKDPASVALEDYEENEDIGDIALDSGEKVMLAALTLTGESYGRLSELATGSLEASETTSSSHSFPPQSKEAPKESYKEKDCTPNPSSRLQIGGDYTYLNLNPEDSSSFYGSLGGAQGSYEYRPTVGFYTGVTFAWFEGVTSGQVGDRSILYIDAQERFGYTLNFNDTKCLLTLYSGLGYRHVWQKISPNTGSSLQLKYDEFYVPVGFLSEYKALSWFSLGANVSWMAQVFSTVAVPAIEGTRWSLSNTLMNFMAEIPLDFTLTKSQSFHIIVKPFYQYWQDGHSTAATRSGLTLGLPENTYNYWGVNVNFMYAF